MKGLTGFGLLCAFSLASAAEVADYRFEGDLHSQIASAPDLVELAPFGGSFAFDPAVGRVAWTVPEGTGLALAAGALVPADRYSVMMQVRVGETDPYLKLIDTRDRAEDQGFYIVGDDIGYYNRAFGDGSIALQKDVYYTIVVTRGADDTYIGYVDGLERFRFTDLAGESLLPGSGMLYFLRDDTATHDGENAPATIARLRVFDTALTPAQVQALGTGTRVFANGFEGG